VKKLTKLGIKKITLRNLDEPKLNAVAGGDTSLTECFLTNPGPNSCPAHVTCAPCPQ
jgi:hypothetical protein